LLATTPLSAQTTRDKPKPLPGDALAERFLKEDTRQVSERFLDGAKSLKDWQARLPLLRREYLDMLGLWPWPEKTPLRATITGTRTRDTVVIDNLHFQSKPGLYVTGNLYRPKNNTRKLPAVLYVCGHSGRGRDGNKTAFQDHGMWFARNGYVCLVVDTLQLGEVAGKHHGTYNLNRWWWHSLAYTPAGVECWNGIRAIDYLVSRKDVDTDRIGVTGISGGGASTIWIAAADDRVKVAVPVSGMSDLESYVSNKIVNGHCDCMFLVNLYRWEWTTIAALIAPRPMLFANSDNDPIFPMDGNRRIIARLRDVYKLHGKGDLVDDFVSKGGHDYRPDLRLAIFRWMNKHLRGDTGAIKDADDKPLPGKELRVFPEDKDLPADALNGKIDETFVPTARVTLPEKKAFARWQKEMIARLKEGPFRHLDQMTASPGTMKLVSPEESAARDRTMAVITDTRSDRWAHAVADKDALWKVTPRGIGDSAWTRRNPPNYVERSYALLGLTVDLGRLHDIAEALRSLAAEKKPHRLVGKGEGGILAAYAALFEPGVSEIVLVDPPSSHRDGPHFLGILRLLDIPDALGLLAPRKLTILGGDEEAFTRTKEIYKLAGAVDRFTRKPAVKE
jgi:dienelactone hydrolase